MTNTDTNISAADIAEFHAWKMAQAVKAAKALPIKAAKPYMGHAMVSFCAGDKYPVTMSAAKARKVYNAIMSLPADTREQTMLAAFEMAEKLQAAEPVKAVDPMAARLAR